MVHHAEHVWCIMPSTFGAIMPSTIGAIMPSTEEEITKKEEGKSFKVDAVSRVAEVGG